MASTGAIEDAVRLLMGCEVAGLIRYPRLSAHPFPPNQASHTSSHVTTTSLVSSSVSTSSILVVPFYRSEVRLIRQTALLQFRCILNWPAAPRCRLHQRLSSLGASASVFMGRAKCYSGEAALSQFEWASASSKHPHEQGHED